MKTVPIMLDQLAWDNGKTFAGIAFKFLEPFKQQFGQLAGIGGRRLALKPVVRIKYDTSFSGVGNDNLEAFQAGGFNQFPIGFVSVDGFLYAGNNPGIIHNLAIHLSPEDYGIKVVLLAKTLQISERDRFDHCDANIGDAFFIGNINHIVHKCT